MNKIQKDIFDKFTEIKDRMEDAKCELALLKAACEKLKQERDTAIQKAKQWENDYSVLAGVTKAIRTEKDSAIQRAEKAEREVGRLDELVLECDGIECTQHDLLVKSAVKETARLRKALTLYGNPENWRFSHDAEGNLLWITSLGPDYAIEILGEEMEANHV